MSTQVLLLNFYLVRFNTLKYILFSVVYSCSFHNTYNKHIIHTHTPVYHLLILVPANKYRAENLLFIFFRC